MSKIEYLKAIKRPFTDFNKFVIGIILILVPVLNIITNFFVRGYQLECSKDLKKNKYRLPEWTDFKKLFVVGILSFLISLIYLLPALIILVISVWSVALDLIKATEPSIETLLTSLTSAEMTGLFVSLALLIITSYFIPIALLEFINKSKFTDAFKINIIIKKAFKSKYFITILLILIYFIALQAVYSLLMMLVVLIPYSIAVQVISVILSSIISFILGVTAFTLLGEIYPKLK